MSDEEQEEIIEAVDRIAEVASEMVDREAARLGISESELSERVGQELKDRFL